MANWMRNANNTFTKRYLAERAITERRRKRHKAAVAGGGETLSSPSFTAENPPSTFVSVVGFGHSIVTGSFASVAGNRFINLFATAKSAGSPLNSGIGGTWLQNTPSVASAPAATTDNGRDRFVGATLGTSKRDALVVMYHINESRYTQDFVNVTPAAYKNDLQECMNGWILGGYRQNKIILSNDVWVTDSRLANTSPVQTRAGLEAFVTATNEVAAEYGVFLADTYNYMKNNGGDALIDGGDTPPLHPGDVGHAAINASLLAAVRSYVAAAAPTAVGTAGGNLTVSFPAITGAVSYDVECTLKGQFTFPNTSNVAVPTKTFTSLAAGEYVCRYRPVYGNGQKGSWNFNIVPVEVGATLFLVDSFNVTADGTTLITHTNGETGHTWANQPVTPVESPAVALQGGRVVSGSATGAVKQASPVPPSANYEVTTWIDTRSVLTTGQCGPAGRMQAAADTFYYARYTEGATPTFSLYKRITGTAVQIGSNYTATIPLNSVVKLTLRMVGTTISLLVDDVVRVTGTNNEITLAGKAGIRLAGVQAADTGAQITAVQAKAL
jgi:hypothetical protein